jgi:hypothetical protein
VELVAALTVREIVVVFVKLPEVPAMVTVAVPVVAVLLAVSVKVLVAVVGLGLNDADTPVGRLGADKLTLLLKPFCGVMVIVLVPLAPCEMPRLAGNAERAKFGTTAAVTVRLMVVEFVKLPEVPVMVTVTVPVVAAPLAVSVKLLEAVAGLVLNDEVTPLGSPEADKLTLLLKPFCGVTEMVLVPLVPCIIVKLLGDADRVKFGGGGRFVLIAALSNVAVASVDVLLLVTPRPMYTVCAMLMVWLVPSCTQFAPSDEL